MIEATSDNRQPTRQPLTSEGHGAKLSPADFRFVSAWVQVVDVRDAWQRFQAHRGTGDLRRIRSTVRGILDHLQAIAVRHGDVQAAALLRRDSTRISAAQRPPKKSPTSDGAAPMPTLAQFTAELADADFYSEAELVELLEERYGKVASLRPTGARQSRALQRDTPELRAVKRKGRLVARQVEALRRLESLAATRPVPEDRTNAWLDAQMCLRLQSVGVLTLGQLQFFIRLHGYRWYRKVIRVGEGKAGRLVQWLREHEDTLGPVAVSALAPVTKMGAWLKEPPPSVGVVPIERLRLPASLSGESGKNRADPEQCSARARNDY